MPTKKKTTKSSAKRKKPARSKRPAAPQWKPFLISQDSVMLLVILQARPGKEQELEKELRALIVPTRQEEGCLRYSLYGATESGNAGTFLFYEVWRTPEDHTLHTQTPHFKHFAARKDELVEARDSAFWKQIA